MLHSLRGERLGTKSCVTSLWESVAIQPTCRAVTIGNKLVL
jgi:hypothetical protein